MDQALFIGWLGFLTTPLTILAVLALSRVAPIPPHYHPLTLLSGLASNLQKKVYPNAERPVLQQQIAGALGTLMLIAPSLIILAIIGMVSEFPVLWNALLLYLALDWEQTRRTAIRIAAQLEKGYKLQARESLNSLVLRQSGRLSSMGIAKACIETLLQRANLQLFAVLFWFAVGGGLMAVTYRALRELAMVWNGKDPFFKQFASLPAALTILMDAIPTRLLAFSYALSGSLKPWFKLSYHWQKTFPNNHAGLLLSCGGSALKLGLGGPLYYQQLKQQRPRLDTGAEPQALDILRTLRLINNAISFWLAITLVIALTIGLLSQLLPSLPS
ncbi:cobalamin biosynthesis protein CobD/CbiB [Corallincola spongiicola]|uniref:Cobalamin biosynthesis protein CobD n=1 Tax=Corallincola spongiicola TaxID=2520508 RepID=A0ABY1WR83_9GAMM|nr:cobalamin biosynthesis protein [Corallincola spongiicola]TAA47135.1 hypothetical protein EXY25_07790 [Corallincola spongiicola]